MILWPKIWYYYIINKFEGYIKALIVFIKFVTHSNHFTKNNLNMKFSKIALAFAMMLTVAFTGCKPKDADIKKNVEAALKADPTMASTVVDVKDGTVTLSGECPDEATKASCEKMALAVKGVKPPVINNCTVAVANVEPMPESTTTVLDEATQQRVKDGIKDIKGVSVSFTADKAVLTGEVSKADRMKIMQILASAKVQADVSGLMDKK